MLAFGRSVQTVLTHTNDYKICRNISTEGASKVVLSEFKLIVQFLSSGSQRGHPNTRLRGYEMVNKSKVGKHVSAIKKTGIYFFRL